MARDDGAGTSTDADRLVTTPRSATEGAPMPKQNPAWTTPGGAAKRREVCERAGYACQECRLGFTVPDGWDGRTALGTTILVGSKRKLRLLEMDHVVPRLIGGGNELENLQALCSGCNARKGAKVAS